MSIRLDIFGRTGPVGATVVVSIALGLFAQPVAGAATAPIRDQQDLAAGEQPAAPVVRRAVKSRRAVTAQAAPLKIDRRLAAVLASLDSSRQPSSLMGRATPAKHYRVAADGRLQVYVVAQDLSAATLEGFTRLGLRDLNPEPAARTVQGWASPSELEAIADLDVVERVRLPDYARSRCEGTYCTEGDALHNAPAVRALGYDGSGIKVGVISDGVDSLALAQASDDLPATVTVHPALPGSGDEGTAMLEIIHDIAPGAELFFSGPDTSIDMVDAINWLTFTAGRGCR
ncbi:MAG: hypothetical protein O3A51_09065 [Verrucomicrobia bacterium]|nr:hypothetical protein [Verrucomicrobiota bacterium]